MIFNVKKSHIRTVWVATWQNQRNGCAPSEDSDQPGRSDCALSEDSDKTGWMPRLIWVFAGRTAISLFCHVASHFTISEIIKNSSLASKAIYGDNVTTTRVCLCSQVELWIYSTEKRNMLSFPTKRVQALPCWYMSRDMTKPTKWVCAQRRLRSAWASAQSDHSLRCALIG